MDKKIKIGIVGASGMTGGILLKLLLNHKYADIVIATSETQTGIEISSIHNFLKNLFPLKTVSYNRNQIINNCDCVFLLKSHGEFQEETSRLTNNGLVVNPNIKFIDISADFRLKNARLYEQWYKFKHSDINLLQKAVYGLPEIYYQKIKNAFFIANPGCYPTAVILSAAPLFSNKLVDTNSDIIINAISGVSGAGKTPNVRNLAVEVEANIKPYKVGKHQHTPEIKQELEYLMQEPIKNILLIPYIAPFKYGILTTTSVKLSEKISIDNLFNLYHQFYQNKPFVRIYNKEQYPEIQNIEGTNFCDIGLYLDEKTNTCIVMGCIDNVIKGAVGQAIQNMNIMFGLHETEGLPFADFLSKSSL